MIDRVEREVEMLERHVAILSQVHENEPIGIGRLSEATGLPDHKVRYSLRVLEEQGIIEPTPDGAVTTAQAGSLVSAFNDRIDEVVRMLRRVSVGNPTARP